MTTQQPKQLAIFPDLPRNVPVSNKDGTMSDDWKLFFDHLVMALQANFTPEGINVPQQSASDIALLTEEQSKANILYDSTNNAFVGNIVNSDTGDQTWVQFATIIDYPGNPNANVEGNVNQLCLDTVNLVLYVCTTGGNAAGAVWTSV